MKVTKEIYLQMKKDLKIVLDHYLYVHNVNFNTGDIPESTYFNLWHIVYSNRRYELNPNIIFVNDKRLLEYNPEFEYYPCNTNDNTLYTALKKATDELLLLY